MASTTSLLSTDTTSSSFDPKKQDRTKRPPPQKDYSTAFSAPQGRYGLADASMFTPLPPSSKKPATPTPANPGGSTPSSSARVAPLPVKQERGEKAKTRSSPLALLRASYHSGGSPVPPSSSASSEGREPGGKGDNLKRDRKVDAATASQPIGEAVLSKST